MTAAVFVLIFIFGLTVGSFLNVCIYRIPAKEDIVLTPSHCKECGHRLSVKDLFPLVSYLCLKGRCRYCGAKISLQYPLVELANGLLWVLVFGVKGFHVTTLIWCVLTSILLVISLIDLRTYEIPVGLNIAIALLGIVMLFVDRDHIPDHLIGALCVSGFFFLLYLLTKGPGIGGGGIKLMAASGLLLGWEKILLAMALGCILGSVIHLTLMRVKGKDRVLAFGPYLALGIFLSMLFGEQMIAAYFGLF